MKIELEFCKMNDNEYQKIRNRHYIPNNGTHGQQIHFKIYKNDILIGIISGASSVYSVESRDLFFDIPKDKIEKTKKYLPAIVNNTVFRLELHEKNLATIILSRWRKLVSELWEEIYGVKVIGFETFVIENDTRKGTLYKADNWDYVGNTKGSTKKHNGLKNKSQRIPTEIKMIYCKMNGKKKLIPTDVYKSSWRAETKEEKDRAKLLSNKRNKLLGKKFEIYNK